MYFIVAQELNREAKQIGSMQTEKQTQVACKHLCTPEIYNSGTMHNTGIGSMQALTPEIYNSGAMHNTGILLQKTALTEIFVELLQKQMTIGKFAIINIHHDNVVRLL